MKNLIVYCRVSQPVIIELKYHSKMTHIGSQTTTLGEEWPMNSWEVVQMRSGKLFCRSCSSASHSSSHQFHSLSPMIDSQTERRTNHSPTHFWIISRAESFFSTSRRYKLSSFSQFALRFLSFTSTGECECQAFCNPQTFKCVFSLLEKLSTLNCRSDSW